MEHAPAILPDDEGLARTRERFLTTETIEPGQVRRPILASWWRSRELRVPADRIDTPYTGDLDPETPLLRGAAPVLERLADQLEGQPISLILTDATGVVLTQRTGDADLHRHLERVELVPGYSYGERFVGTNGIGTALEDGRPTSVFGHEHYAEHLENLACAGVPIQHPISGKTLGAVDLTCWRKDAGGLLVALARSAAEQVRQALLTHSNLRELVLFQSYLQACRRTTGIVLAFNDDVVMMNDSARRLLDPADQTMLLNRAGQELSVARRASVTLTLSSGSKVRVSCRRVTGDREGDVAGGVLSVKLLDSDESTGTSLPMLPMFLPGVVGSAPPWLRASHDVDAGFTRGEWLVLAGEPGTGKYTLARGVHQRRNPAGRLHVLDAARMTADWHDDLRRELVDDPVDTLVIRHADRLAGPDLHTLVSVLREARAKTWVTITLPSDAETDPELLALFPRTVTVPPLRRHAEDLGDLVPLFLARLAPGGTLTCSPAALHLLMRASWPGNVTQLYRVLKQITKRRRTGTIVPTDLPAEYHALTRRPLNRFETVERDAIVRGLADANGNKVRAAKLLGISRATIYRKIHEYGIVTPDR
ncbi:transcriptional regulator of acetoin/glycerol metabolism [Amycolatopsis bartoniae]|uniref:Fis family transcriptional regulator n=1 Tax=Amycolatopsis bartoniae TaxID=941986 RepID=A0A8H9M2R1_9PSEU|nr:helix-turn-helix domain-containing protein [Amycolatopsis bartoniae]MBB2938132.1 transcriptional regulator of acetoin/glycerol metabolism [Amycolatopsis bartoniae]TVS99439.1 GAF domain-containing protein [Amycolatopsis bartoniae]GHF32893.1 Fis family transcriptional regulator [Amycolatopsis bartoniae]